MTLDRMKLSAQTTRDTIAIMEQCEDVDDAGYYLQLEYEKFVLECIEKQIPKKPRETRCALMCANCGHKITEKGCKKLNRFYCKKCGQALDWSDTE